MNTRGTLAGHSTDLVQDMLWRRENDRLWVARHDPWSTELCRQLCSVRVLQCSRGHTLDIRHLLRICMRKRKNKKKKN